jgi:hypothetical protein
MDDQRRSTMRIVNPERSAVIVFEIRLAEKCRKNTTSTSKRISGARRYRSTDNNVKRRIGVVLLVTLLLYIISRTAREASGNIRRD